MELAMMISRTRTIDPRSSSSAVGSASEGLVGSPEAAARHADVHEALHWVFEVPAAW